MSNLSVNTITNAAGGNTAQINGMTPTADSLQGFRNRIINGDMRIDQRNAGASVTPTASAYTIDRWLAAISQASKLAVQQNAGAVLSPSGFTNYLGATSTSAYSLLSSDFFVLQHKIEGFNVADLGWGTAAASSVTLSFWVRSSLTGTFGGSFGADGTRSYSFSYTISASNTWEYKTVIVPGDTSGTWNKTNQLGLTVTFGLGVGSTFSGTAGSWSASNLLSATGAVSVVGTSGATFYITGVQLEKGSVATEFERRPYGTELALCQRYYYRCTNYALGLAYNVNVTYGFGLPFPVTMRAAPTLDASGNSFEVNTGSAGTVGVYNNVGLRLTQFSAPIQNTALNWTAIASVCVSAGFSAEL